ncbi:hypothetical protein C2869_12370 [Saccharobesus litoralis]|uniref:TonB C-terminal domain-containing protein n=1 Tax=Saccharobesus litoralis TaxID=2172099 RepID=A0A2S0VSV3_9ALTE|nr:energy transducer TonB [Saccharobesus litoralis]AWB67180.1 hypothetical protein C2869_12370 [Saccharobesus litoralis]
MEVNMRRAILTLLLFISNQLFASDNYTPNEVLLQRAAIGDTKAQLLIGVNYYKGNGVEKDPIEASAWLYLAFLNSDKNEDYQAIFAQQASSLTDEQLNQVEARLKKLVKTYSKRNTSKIFSPVLISDIDCKDRLPPKPKKRQAPKYPMPALKQGVIGSTQLEFSVSKYGNVRDIEVVKYTDKAFVKPSLIALERWQYISNEEHYTDVSVHLNYNIQGKSSINPKAFKKQLEKALSDNTDARAQYLAKDWLNIVQSHLSNEQRKDVAKWYKQEREIKHSPFQWQEQNFWLMKAAQNGLAQAQFELGINMQRGRGCKVDKTAAEQWLQAAANQNYLPAKALAGLNLLKKGDFESQKAAIELLKSASESKSIYRPRLELAWVLSTTEHQLLRDPEFALDILDDNPRLYRDTVRILETQAAAYAAEGDFDEAEDLQEEAIEEAEELGWQINPEMAARLAKYKNKQLITGDYYL